MHSSTRAALAVTITLLAAACAKKEASTDSAAGAADSTAAMAPAPAPTLALADVAGKWNVRAVPEAGADTSPTEFVLDAKPDTTGWTMTFAKSGLKVTPSVHTSGDTLMLKAGPFASQRRKGVKVSTESALRVENGKLVGRTTAHYVTKGADSVTMLRTEGTKAP
jgi:hypothetical protein